MSIDPQRLKEFLVSSELISEKDFNRAIEKSKKSNKKITEVLVEEKLVEQENLTKFEAYLAGIPFVSIGDEKIDQKVLDIIPENIARAHNIIAFRKNGDNLEVAMSDPGDLITIDFIKKTDPSLKILPRLTTPDGLKKALRQYNKGIDVEFGDILKSDLPSDLVIKSGGKSDKEASNKDLIKISQDLPVIKIVDTFLKHAILQKASDIHIEPLEQEMIIRFRIDGILHDIVHLPITVSPGVVARIKILSNLKLDEHRLPQDGRFKIENEDYKYSVRVSIIPVFNGEKIVMRLLPENMGAQTLESLGFWGDILDKVSDNLKKPTGMILVTGPTGSGKTTTLYEMMEILNTTKVNISTLEDPIEYRMPRINQTQINPQIGLTFASGLRSLVRQDPNVIMVGEIRDGETANLAVNAALTGHLVLSTLHTTEAAGAIPRLIDMGVEPFLIASTVNVIIAQRLVRKLSIDKEKYSLGVKELKNLSKYCDMQRILNILKEENILKSKDNLEKTVFYRPKSSKISVDGYKGRLGIYEVLTVNEAIRELIIKKASTKDIADQAKKDGMKTMVEDGFIKVARGLTSIEEVLRVIIN